MITTAAQLDALPVGTILADNGMHPFWHSRLNHWCAANGTIDVALDLAIRDGAPFTVLYRPDAPARTEPTEEPQRVAPSEEKIAKAMQEADWRTPLHGVAFEDLASEHRDWWLSIARAAAALYASQPTVAEVRAQALEDAAHYLRAWGPGMDEAARQIDHLANRRAERGEA